MVCPFVFALGMEESSRCVTLNWNASNSDGSLLQSPLTCLGRHGCESLLEIEFARAR